MYGIIINKFFHLCLGTEHQDILKCRSSLIYMKCAGKIKKLLITIFLNISTLGTYY